MKDALRRWPAATRARLLRLNLIARMDARDGLSRIANDPTWKDALDSAHAGQRVLIATNTGGHFAIETIDRLIGASLTIRGAAVTHVLCDAVLPACQMCEFNLAPDIAAVAARGPDKLLCGYCYEPARERLRKLGMPLRMLSSPLGAADLRDAKDLASVNREGLAQVEWRGVPVGAHALAGTLRFFARSDLENEPHGEAVLRRYVEAAILTAAAYERHLDDLKPDVVVAHHGIYTPQGLAVAVARSKGVRVVTWNPAYRRHCFIFSHGDSYHYTLMNEPISAWRDEPFDDTQRERALAYLHSRRAGDGDWIKFHRDPSEAGENAIAALALDSQKPTIVAYTNVFWDAQLHFPSNAFANQKEWLESTIAWFARRPDLDLVIRVHPAEISGSPPSRQMAQDVIAARFPELPPNVRVVGPESALSSYALAVRANAALIFGTKLGVELSAIGVPVIVAGEAWVRGKGFTHDASSPADYEAKLALLPFAGRLDANTQDIALKYAHHFFFRRMIELPFVESRPGPRRFRVVINGASDLAAGRWPGLDAICSGILTGAPFAA